MYSHTFHMRVIIITCMKKHITIFKTVMMVEILNLSIRSQYAKMVVPVGIYNNST